MANFSAYSPLLLEAEGGYQASAADSGNYNSLGQLVGTNRGISAPTYEAWIGHPPTVAEMKAITEATALEIYEQNYWNALGLSNLNSQALANIICDHAVNAGNSRAGRIIQTCCNLMGSSLIVDGVVGPKTREAINSHDAAALHDSFKQARLYYYAYLCKYTIPQYWYDLFKSWGIGSSTGNQVWYNGWINRVNTFPWLSGEDGGDAAEIVATSNPVLVNDAIKKKLHGSTRRTRR